MSGRHAIWLNSWSWRSWTKILTCLVSASWSNWWFDSHSSDASWFCKYTWYQRHQHASPSHWKYLYLRPLQIMTMPWTLVEWVHNTMGQANLTNDLLVRLAIVIHYATKVCETFGDLDILTTCMNRLSSIIQQTSKWPNLGLGPKDLQPQRLCLFMQYFRSFRTSRFYENTLSANTRSMTLMSPKDAINDFDQQLCSISSPCNCWKVMKIG